jgi:hypothetical protein
MSGGLVQNHFQLSIHNHPLIECMVMKRAYVTQTKLLAQWRKFFLMFQRVKILCNTVFQAAVSRIDIFKFCYHGFFIFLLLAQMTQFLSVCPFHTFCKHKWFRGKVSP